MRGWHYRLDSIHALWLQRDSERGVSKGNNLEIPFNSSSNFFLQQRLKVSLTPCSTACTYPQVIKETMKYNNGSLGSVALHNSYWTSREVQTHSC